MKDFAHVMGIDSVAEWTLFVALSGGVCLLLAFVYNAFIEGRFTVWGKRWDNDTAVDMAVVIGCALVTISQLIAYALYPTPPMGFATLTGLMFWYYVVWGAPMVIGHQRRLLTSRRHFDEGMQAVNGQTRKVEMQLWVLSHQDEVRRLLNEVETD